MPYTIATKFNVEAGHRLLNHTGLCKNLHGHSYVFELFFQAKQLDEQGFVIDFGKVKEQLKSFFDGLDHAMMLHEQDPLLPLIANEGLKIVALKFHPSAENLAWWVFGAIKVLSTLNNQDVQIVKVRCYETAKNFAEYGED